MATATKPAERPGPRLDVQPRKITTDYALNEVSPGSDAAAFSWLPADLERVRARREELGLNDDKARAQRESQEAELKLAKRKLAVLQADVEAMEANLAEPSATDGAPKPGTKAALQARATELGVDPEGTVDELKERIAKAEADAADAGGGS